MKRTIISLKENEKEWLDQVAKDQHVSMATVIRNAITEYRKNHANLTRTRFDKLLKQTQGLWTAGDGLRYQKTLRNEWSTKK